MQGSCKAKNSVQFRGEAPIFIDMRHIMANRFDSTQYPINRLIDEFYRLYDIIMSNDSDVLFHSRHKKIIEHAKFNLNTISFAKLAAVVGFMQSFVLFSDNQNAIIFFNEFDN